MCGRATGRRGELRLAKLSLAVRELLFAEENQEEEEEEEEEKERKEETAETEEIGRRGEETRRALQFLPSVATPPSPTSWDPPAPVKSPQISSFSSSCTQPALDLIAYPVAPFPPVFSFSFSAPLLSPTFFFAPSSAHRHRLSRRGRGIAGKSRKPVEVGPRIDLMRIIPALIAKAHGMVQQAALVRLARPAVRSFDSPTGWSADRLPSVNHS